MGVVKQIRRGLIHEDGFDTSVLGDGWEIAPNDPARWSLTDVSGSLRLKHGADPLYLFFDQLRTTEQFVMDVKNVYNPQTVSDVGGIVIYSDDDDYIKIEEYYDPEQGVVKTYPWLRLVRSFNTYTAYWSEDGVVWNLIGTEAYDREAPKIGLFLEGETGEFFDIDYIRITTEPSVVVSNLTAGMRIDLFNLEGQLLATRTCRRGDTKVRLSLGNVQMPLTGKFTVFMADGSELTSSESLSIWAGDEYMFNPSPDIYYVNTDNGEVRLLTNIEEFLGYVTVGRESRNVAVLVKNEMLVGSLLDINIQLTDYKGTGDYLTLTEIAFDVDGEPDTFGQSLSIPLLTAGQTRKLWLRLNRAIAWLSDEAYFGLDVTSRFDY